MPSEVSEHAIMSKPSLRRLASKSRDALLDELKYHRCFHEPLDDLLDPYIKMLSTYRDFQTSIVEAVERGDAEIMALVRDGMIDYMYRKIPRLAIDKFPAWAKLAEQTHPLRRRSNQHLFVTIVPVQDRAEFDSLTSKVMAIVGECQERRERVLDPENLVKDPDQLYFFRHRNGIKDVSVKDVAGTCLICTEVFDETLHLPQQGPCGHIICKQCFDRWLLSCSKLYICPMCRACVVCGADSCANHIMKTEPVRPATLPHCLDAVLRYRMGELLHGILPQDYWRLREDTRPARVQLAYIARQLPANTDTADPAVELLMRDANRALGAVRIRTLEILLEASNRSPAHI